MANQEHITLLKLGIETWNDWKIKHPMIRPDLSGAILIEANLIKAILSGANLTGANLSRTNLSGAILNRADLNGVYLREANLTEADLSRAILTGADFTGANLSRTNLSGTNLSRTILKFTRFTSNNLTTVKGLDTIIHKGPSTIDFETVILPPPGPTRTTFLRGTGSSPYLIEALNGTILPFEPVPVKVFMSYAHPDEELCKHLQAHLSLLIREKTISLTLEAVLAPEIEHWKATPNTAFQEAQILLLLISAPFLASHHAWEDIIKPAFCRWQDSSIHLIPIILRPIAWQESPLATIKALPLDGKPVTDWGDVHAAFTDIVKSISSIARPLHTHLREQAKKRRERDLLTAKIILNNTATVEKQDQAKKQNTSVEEQKAVVQKAENAYKEAYAQLIDAQQLAETLHTDLTSLTNERSTLHDQIDALNAQIQEEIPIPLDSTG